MARQSCDWPGLPCIFTMDVSHSDTGPPLRSAVLELDVVMSGQEIGMTNKRKKNHRAKKGVVETPRPSVSARVLANSPMSRFKDRLADRRDLHQRLGQTGGDSGHARQSAPASTSRGLRPRRGGR